MTMNTEAMIFVFGSNEAGVHGAGAAKYARRHRAAVLGVGEGPTGTAYALPTKGRKIEEISLDRIRSAVQRFMVYAKKHPEQQFMVTRVGCGLGGHKDADIAPMFAKAPGNCFFDTEWKDLLPEDREFWGTT